MSKCKTCGSDTHYTAFCFQTRKKQIRPKAETLNKITETRMKWIKLNPPDKHGYWECYLKISPNCLGRMWIDQLTLDHVLPRSSHPHLRYALTNLKASCAFCNSLKGSRKISA